ncbi:hypothetical protein [Butyrivibrio proteoclasticus]|uniref:hypothetical protein n=1 Tax=Butyrivibrio proteoclasticus TaxID=43305 RepID=UPI00047C48AC|nr:hypothetical protein [Butyrivibrio proteoclasticus]
MESFELTMKYRLFGFIFGPIFVLVFLALTISSIVLCVTDGGWIAVFGIACFFIFMTISIYGFISFLSYFEKISVENNVVTISIAGKERYSFKINDVSKIVFSYHSNKGIRSEVTTIFIGDKKIWLPEHPSEYFKNYHQWKNFVLKSGVKVEHA